MNVVYTTLAVVQTRWGLALPVATRPEQDVSTLKIVSSSLHKRSPSILTQLPAILLWKALVYTRTRWIQGGFVHRLSALH